MSSTTSRRPKGRFVTLALAAGLALATACGGDSTGPEQGPPSLTVVNGVPHPTGLVGMTVAIQGVNLGDAANGKVFFTPTGGTPIQATIANAADWSDAFVVTTVPAGITADANITVQTAVGTSNPVPFTLVSSAAFSPSTITWTRTTDLPVALQGLGAVYVPVTTGTTHPSYVYTVGGADAANVAVTTMYRAQVQTSGALGAWSTMTPLPAARAYHTVVAATAYTAPLDTTTTAAYVYAVGGVDATAQTVSSVYVTKVSPDGTVGAWQSTTALPAALHSAAGAVFRGYLYLVGGADNANAPVATTYRAAVKADGTLGAWETLAPLPQATSHLSLTQFGPYLYAVGGNLGTVTPVLNTSTTTESGMVYAATINLRDGSLGSAGWVTQTSMTKARSKHSTLAAGGALLTSSGVYGGAAGSSENSYALLNASGGVGSWQGATGVNTIASVTGYSLYNEAALSFADATGLGHVIIIGGADRAVAGKASAAVIYY
ncbi:MAG TPA: hypothetical protein VFN38_09955 [Gemmatimonadaceae bacterium]|nr:hypothetical protein [Gemmatimonadaceae bacterium]